MRLFTTLITFALVVLAACGDSGTATTTGATQPTVAPTTTVAATAPPTTGGVMTSTTPPPATAQTPVATTPAPTTTLPVTTTAPDPFFNIVVTVASGVVDGGGRVEVDGGTMVRITVTSDVADELHIHGYDLFADLEPGVPGVLEFVADIPGIFEVELEDARLEIIELVVGA